MRLVARTTGRIRALHHPVDAAIIPMVGIKVAKTEVRLRWEGWKGFPAVLFFS